MNTKQINNFKVTPVLDNKASTFVRGSDLIKEPYANICVIGGKKSGKSNMIYRLMERLAHRCEVVIFSPTLYNDPTYKKMIKMLEQKKKCRVTTYDHFIDHETGANRLQHYRLLFQKEAEEREHRIEMEKYKKELPPPPKPKKKLVVNFGDPEEEEEIKEEPLIPKKPTKLRPLTPERIFIYDDLSSNMKHPEVYQLMNKNRHFKMKNIIALHSVNDCVPNTWQNIDYCLAFPNIPKERIEQLQEKLGITFKDDTKKNKVLWNAYEKATQEKYNMLYIDKNECELRHNFNKLILL